MMLRGLLETMPLEFAVTPVFFFFDVHLLYIACASLALLAFSVTERLADSRQREAWML